MLRQVKKIDAQVYSSVENNVTHVKLRNFFYTWLCLIITSLLICSLWYGQQSQKTSHITHIPPSTTHTYTLSSSRGAVRSRIIKHQSALHQTIITYPQTGIANIDKTVATIIDNAIPSQQTLPTTIAARSNTITYRIIHQDDTTISLAVFIRTTTPHTLPTNTVHYWTFDKMSGQPITSSALVDTSIAGINEIVIALRKQVQQRYPHAEPVKVAEVITPESITNFLVHDRKTIGFLFDKRSLGIGVDGIISLKLPIKQLSHFVQNPTTKKLFDIPPSALSSTTDCVHHRCIALTFDDGPGLYTQTLLEHLDRYHAKATFFVVGRNVAPYSIALQQAVQRKHQIGNHTWNHPLLPKRDEAVIRQEIESTNSAVAAATGVTPTMVRPPYGGMNDKVRAQLQQLTMPAIMWSIDTRDWADHDAAIVCSRAVANAAPGAIILMHDIHKTSVDAVPCILDALQKQGYRFVTVKNLFGHPLSAGESYSQYRQ